MFTDERIAHILDTHPEMSAQLGNIETTLKYPEIVIRSRTDQDVELIYKRFDVTPVTDKYLCVVVKTRYEDAFIVTSYFTNTIKKRAAVWERK
jgi:molybdopterin synthase catalytic subunit